jgi:hypothetical protein
VSVGESKPASYSLQCICFQITVVKKANCAISFAHLTDTAVIIAAFACDLIVLDVNVSLPQVVVDALMQQMHSFEYGFDVFLTDSRPLECCRISNTKPLKSRKIAISFPCYTLAMIPSHRWIAKHDWTQPRSPPEQVLHQSMTECFGAIFSSIVANGT